MPVEGICIRHLLVEMLVVNVSVCLLVLGAPSCTPPACASANYQTGLGLNK